MEHQINRDYLIMGNQKSNDSAAVPPVVNQKGGSNLKLITVVLAVLFIGILVYVFKMTSDINAIKKELVTTATTTSAEKESLLKELQELKANYDDAISKNTSMTSELTQERDKVSNLISDLNKTRGDASKFKTKVKFMQDIMKILVSENDSLKRQNGKLIVQRDSAYVVLGESKKSLELLTGQNKELTKTVEKGAKLAVVNTKALAYRVKGSGKQMETDKASNTNMLKVGFTIAENQIAKSGSKTYYVQVINSRNDVLGDKKTESFGNKNLTYSFISKVKYENKTVNVSKELSSKIFPSGTYFVNVFDNGELVSKTSFTLL